MAVWSHILKSDLVGAIRLDAEFWQPDYLSKEKAIRACSHIPLGALVSTFRKGIFYILASEYYEKGTPFYRSSNVGAVLPNNQGLAFIAESKHKVEYKTALKAGDLMMVKTGRSGASIVLEPHCNVSQDVIAIKVHRDRVNPYYLALYLNTRFGSSEMNRWFQGQVQPHLSLDDARRILVTLLPEDIQQETEALVRESAGLRAESTTGYQHAHELLESELGLDKLTFKKPVGYIAQLSRMETSRRSDADFFNPELRFLQSELSQQFVMRQLPEFASVLKFSNPPYGTDGIPIITQRHLSDIAPSDYGNDLVTPTSWITRNPEAVLKKHDLLYYSVGAYLGKTNQWLADEKAVHASFITMLRCHSEEDAGYLQVLLNSRYGILQSKCFQSGTSQPYIYPKDIRRFLVPDLSKSVRLKIHNLVLESYKKEQESKRLLEQAKTRVEELIEAGIQS